MPLIKVVQEESDNGLIVAIEPVGDFQMTYDMIEGLVEVLSEKFDIVFTEKMDGAGERLWKIKIEGIALEIYDEFGARLEVTAPDKDGKEFLGRVGDFLEKRIPKD